MTRLELEHIIRAAASITNTTDIVVIGSQSILGRYPHAPSELLVSVEADIYPRDAPELSDLIDGSIGELSPFHETFGYYAQGVSERTAVLPDGWQARLVAICNDNTRGATGWCLEPHDLVIAKLIAGRDKDLRFARDAAARGLVDRESLQERVALLTAVSTETRGVVGARIAAAFGP